MNAVQSYVSPQEATPDSFQCMSIRSLTVADRIPAAKVLARAFRGYPVMRYLFENHTGDVEGSMQALFEYVVASCLASGGAVCGSYAAGSLMGVAVTIAPGSGESESSELYTLFEAASRAMGVEPLERFAEYMSACENGAPKEFYHYLVALGVLPEYRKGGFGTALLKSVKAGAVASANSKGVYLHTESLRNISFYERAAFRIVNTSEIGSVNSWRMLWDRS